MKRVCKVCLKKKDLTAFQKVKDYCYGRGFKCKACALKQWYAWSERNADYLREYRRKMYWANKPKYQAICRDYREKNREKLNRYNSLYKKRNRARINMQDRLARQERINYKLAKLLRNRLRDALKEDRKGGSAVKNLGCTLDKLRDHLEHQFQRGMNWKNWTVHGWHIDHIKPLCGFDLTDPKQVKKACHYRNLRPAWAKDNWAKGKRPQSFKGVNL